MEMFELSNNVAILKTRKRMLEQRKQRILAQATDDRNSLYWAQADLERIENELREVKAQLAEKEEGK